MEIKIKDRSVNNMMAIIAVAIYFISFAFYLYFYRIEKNVDLAFLFKPIIIPSIAFAYFFLTKNTFYFINIFLFLVVYFADNLILLQDRSLYVFSTYLYLISVAILCHYVVVDSKIFDRKPFIKKMYPYFLFILLLSVLVVKIYNYIYELPFKEVYLIGLYVFLFLTLLVLTIFNVFINRSIASKFLLGTILSLFVSDIFIAVNNYYFKNDLLIYVACIIEIPVYYFLLRYFLNREEHVIQ